MSSLMAEAVGDGHNPWLWNTPEYGEGYTSPGGFALETDMDDDDWAALAGIEESGYDAQQPSGGYEALEHIDAGAELTSLSLLDGSDIYEDLGVPNPDVEVFDFAEQVERSATPEPVLPAANYGSASKWSADDINCYGCAFAGVMSGWFVEHGYLMQVEQRVVPTVKTGRTVAAVAIGLGLLIGHFWQQGE